MDKFKELYDGTIASINLEYFDDFIDGFYEESKLDIIDDIDRDDGFTNTLSSASFASFQISIRNNEDEKENIRVYINKLMYDYNITQSELSKKSWINESTLSRYINGSREMSDYVAMRIILAMGLNLKEAKIFMRKVGRTFKRTKRDAVVVEAIAQNITDVFQVEAVIRSFTDGKESLFTARENKEITGSNDDWNIEILD